jgi:hypothetical protein
MHRPGVLTGLILVMSYVNGMEDRCFVRRFHGEENPHRR